MRSRRKHWRSGGVTSTSDLSACGRWLNRDDFVVGNVEAVDCGNCQRSQQVAAARQSHRREARASAA